ncbi:MAG TPA: hypothetical protein VH254_08470 [Candidatus Udaeobacter sp.]|nr:hypothetical protein [Candidatus Udaeobacter sp.]
MSAHINLEDRLSILRTEDRVRKWSSLDDERLCIICKRRFTGRQVEIRRLVGHRHELLCPTEGCNSGTHLWIYPTTPLVSHVAARHWWRTAGKQHRSHPPVMRAHGSRL